ncbi:hypothetical protein IU431_06710 [Nocardia otitidiscaviarum]|uniref:hypothetical protein n=1 Tax=Nocardia otitidiscaviarum TaxID=1823 RepID=UPI0004A718A0|nr:hypothetical protein [Nocardia otitidiscaviarum]MBF6483848.1 hypothetical protein [Nocardia otitidiscaviarum]
MTDEPTQCRHPARAAARSTAATLVGLGPLVPLLVAQLGETRAAVVLAVALAGNAVITRLLAVPEVEEWLQRVLPLLAASTSPGRHRRDDP